MNQLIVVSNSSPIIALARIQRLYILQKLFGTIHIPNAVYNEIVSDVRNRKGKHEVLESDWIIQTSVTDINSAAFLMTHVDAGEAEAISLANEKNANLLLIDDKEGRKAAKSAGIPITGTIGILLRYYRNKPSEFEASLNELISQGFRLKDSEYGKLLRDTR